MKIIIDIRDNIPTTDALMRVAQVIEDGRTSNNGKNYCYISVWPNNQAVNATRNKKSDTFIVHKYNIEYGI